MGDGQSGQYLAYGDNMQNATSDAWFGADYLLLSYLNVSVTRIPDAHDVWEAKYNGARVVTASWDRSVRVWNADGSGQPLILRGHQSSVTDASFDPTGQRVVSASEDRIVRQPRRRSRWGRP